MFLNVLDEMVLWFYISVKDGDGRQWKWKVCRILSILKPPQYIIDKPYIKKNH